jgi:hypothetical protein
METSTVGLQAMDSVKRHDEMNSGEKEAVVVGVLSATNMVGVTAVMPK